MLKTVSPDYHFKSNKILTSKFSEWMEKFICFIVSKPPEYSWKTDYLSMIPLKHHNVRLTCMHLFDPFLMNLQWAFNWIWLKSFFHYEEPGTRGHNLLQFANLITQFMSLNNVSAIHKRTQSRAASDQLTCNSFSCSQLRERFIVFVWKLLQPSSIS